MYAHIRDRFKAKTIAVTGNAGKTTTKEVLDNILRDQFITLSSRATGTRATRVC